MSKKSKEYHASRAYEFLSVRACSPKTSAGWVTNGIVSAQGGICSARQAHRWEVTEDAFGEQQLKTQTRKKVDCISVVFDRERHELDVVTLGGKRFIEQVAHAFLQAFSSEQPEPQPLIRRKINFEKLLRKTDLIPVETT